MPAVPAVPPFRDRTDAGQHLAARLEAYAYRPDVLVLGLPRGGMAVAFVVASMLHVDLDIVVVRKLGVPGQNELALGALALLPSRGGSNGTMDRLVARVLDADLVRRLRIPDAVIGQIVRREEQELERRERQYRGNRSAPSLAGRTLLLIDDGIATGATMQAALAVVRQQQPARVVAAAPVAHRDTCTDLRRVADEVVCVLEPDPLWAVAVWYQQFPQTSDHEIHRLLGRMQARAWHFQEVVHGVPHAAADAQASEQAAPGNGDAELAVHSSQANGHL
jgi:putative phosphoribosyl transferase